MNILMIFLKVLFQTFSSFYIIININKDNSKKNNKILLFILSYFYLLIVNLYIPNQIRFFSYILVISIIIFFTLNKNLKASIILSLISIIISSLSELLVTGIVCCFGCNLYTQINNVTINFLVNIIISLISIILYIILKKIIIKTYNFFVNRKKAMNYIYIVILLFYLIVARNALFSTISIKVIINMSILFIFIVLFVIITINESKSNHLEEINKQSMNYIKKYEKIITEQGKANHEFKNQLMVIKGYAQMNSPKLMDYLNTLIEDTNKLESTYIISQLNKFPDGGIKGLLYYKLSVMEENKIKYNIYSEDKAKKKFKNLSVEQVSNITKVIGVMLDNAIDAAKKSTKKEISISLLNARGKVNFIVENTFKGNIDKEKIGTGYTTKGKGHGYGLQLTKDIINNKNYLNYSFKIDDNLYISNLEIYTEKNL